MRYLGLLAIGILTTGTPAAANTSIFINAGTACTAIHRCTELTHFGFLTGVSDTLQLKGGVTINGGVGIDTGSKLEVSGGNKPRPNVFNDIIDFADPMVVSTTVPCPAGRNACYTGTVEVNGVASQQNTMVTTAYTQLTNIETYLNTLTSATALPTSGALNVETGGGVRIYSNAGNYSQTGALTFGCGGVTCNAGDRVVIRLAGSTAQFRFNVNLKDGLTSDQVIFYLPTANLTMDPTTAIAIHADFFVGTGAYTIGGTTGTVDPIVLTGRVLGGNGTLTINRSGVTQNDPGVATPEPGTWLLMGAGMGALLWFGYRRQKTQAS